MRGTFDYESYNLSSSRIVKSNSMRLESGYFRLLNFSKLNHIVTFIYFFDNGNYSIYIVYS